MTPPTPHRVPPLLEAAAARIQKCAREAVARTIESLGLAALATTELSARDRMLAGQYELNRKSSFFLMAFDEEFQLRLRRGTRPRDATRPGPSSWDSLSLVADDEVERSVSAERFGMALAHAGEWELRELEAYMVSLLGRPDAPNPLGPEAIGFALVKGIEAATDRPEIRAVFLAEIGRNLSAELRLTYKDIVSDLHRAGVQPAGLSVRASPDLPGHGGRSGHGGLDDAAHSSLHAGLSTMGNVPPAGGHPAAAARGSRWDADSTRDAGARSTRGGALGSTRRGSAMGQVDPELMTLIRSLAHGDPGPASGPGSHWDAPTTGSSPPNLIRHHREELRQAATGSLDHMVIDVIGTLFDQILSDPKVPPQMARQIARLQLPVLRAALGDPSFFSSRRHPVRRFVNRIASLAAAFDDFGAEDARRFLTLVKTLVQDIVDGDFDHIEVYERKLDELEAFVANAAREEVASPDNPVELVEQKETELRLLLRYAAQLQSELERLEGPDFVREFLIETWSQVLMRAARKHGADSDEFKRLRGLARDLFMSVQPKGTQEQRKEFLAMLPKLMQGLNAGMDLIAWPDSARKAFFGLLLPAHAQSLKGQGLRTLDYNLLARRVDDAFGATLPRPEELPPAGADLPVLDDAIAEPSFSPDEATRIGLLEESRIDWAAPVAPDAQVEPAVTAIDIDIDGLPPPDAPEETSGRALAEHVQLGCAYRMHLEDGWHKVKLAHVSPGRSCFIFSHGQRHRRTVSLTRRMLVRLCETGRLRAYESAYLIERATARARRQLSALGAAGAA